MSTVPPFHSPSAEDGATLVFHNRSECPLGQDLKRRGTALPGKGNFRVICPTCLDLAQGSPGHLPF